MHSEQGLGWKRVTDGTQRVAEANAKLRPGPHDLVWGWSPISKPRNYPHDTSGLTGVSFSHRLGREEEAVLLGERVVGETVVLAVHPF